MKAKEVKILRKKIEKADRIEDQVECLVDSEYGQYKLHRILDDEPRNNYRLESLVTSGEQQKHYFRLQCAQSWHKIKPSRLFDGMMQLFHNNMSELYEASSWGLNMEEKREEMQHRKARFLIVTVNDMTAETTSEGDEKHASTTTQENEGLVAFCHYRFEYDDDQNPSYAALYLYEIQISKRFQARGLGQCLMWMLHDIALRNQMPKVLLTVFKANTTAMSFYCNKMLYRIDESSPSQHNEQADYEVLSKIVTAAGWGQK